MKYCEKCGAPLYEDSLICPNCGHHLHKEGEGNSQSSTLKTVAIIFMIISGAFAVINAFVNSVFYLISLAWIVPMTVYYVDKVKKNEPVGTAFKVCSLIFVSLVAGILMLCDKED